MAYTIQQARLVNRVSEILVSQRRATLIQCQSIKSEFDTYNTAQLALDKSQAFAANLGNVLDNLQANKTEIIAAATLVGVSDFVSRWQELDAVRDTLSSATTGNIGARLAAVIAGIPEETIF